MAVVGESIEIEIEEECPEYDEEGYSYDHEYFGPPSILDIREALERLTKQVKPEVKYVGVLFFEERDEFAGCRETRKELRVFACPSFEECLKTVFCPGAILDASIHSLDELAEKIAKMVPPQIYSENCVRLCKPIERLEDLPICLRYEPNKDEELHVYSLRVNFRNGEPFVPSCAVYRLSPRERDPYPATYIVDEIVTPIIVINGKRYRPRPGMIEKVDVENGVLYLENVERVD